MSDQPVSELDAQDASPEQMSAALFAHLVVQQSNMALMLLGKTPHPETGKTIQDLEAAKLFIGLLEMLEAKTKGNLSKEESGLLKQTLMTLRLSFVEAVEAAPSKGNEQPKQEAASSTVLQPAEPPKAVLGAADEDEHRKKFSKKY